MRRSCGGHARHHVMSRSCGGHVTNTRKSYDEEVMWRSHDKHKDVM